MKSNKNLSHLIVILINDKARGFLSVAVKMIQEEYVTTLTRNENFVVSDNKFIANKKRLV